MIHNIYKQRGETPLERIHRFRAENPKFKNEKFTYLGRLDPMPEGSIDGVEIPSKNINIYKMEFFGLQTLSPKELFGSLLMDISKVKGDFRQNEILITWKKVVEGIANKDSKNNTETKIF